jgi:hypothetical protein
LLALVSATVGSHGWVSLVALGTYESAHLYWSPISSDPGAIQITQGPDLTGKLAGGTPVTTEGDYIVLTTGGNGSTGAGPGTFVFQVATAKLWFIPARPNTFVDLGGMSNSEVLLMEIDANSNYAYFKRYLRFDLTKLDDLAQGWGP